MVALVPTSVADALRRIDGYPQEERYAPDRMVLITWILKRPPEELFDDQDALQTLIEVKLLREEIEQLINFVEQTGNKEYALKLFFALDEAVNTPVLPHGNATDLGEEQEKRLRKLAGLPKEPQE